MYVQFAMSSGSYVGPGLFLVLEKIKFFPRHLSVFAHGDRVMGFGVLVRGLFLSPMGTKLKLGDHFPSVG